MAQFPPGNRFWEARSSAGAKPKFATPEQLEKSCREYFQWVEDNPLWEMKAFAFQGVVTQEPVANMRAMTIGGLSLFLDITRQTWGEYRKRADLSDVTSWAEETIRDQKFGGAAADLLNANIIARDLGLKDNSEVDHKSTDGSMSPKVADLSDDDLEEKLKSYGITKQ